MTSPAGDHATTPACDECEQERIRARFAAEAAEVAALAALHKAERDAEHELVKLFHTTVAEVATGSIERSRDSAKYVQTAAAAIGTLYSGLLALAFSVADNPLPLRGVWAAMFLGLSGALSTAYLAFQTKPATPPMFGGGNSLADLQFHRTGWLTKFVNSTVLNRRYAIRASVLALGFGVAFVPAPFVATRRPPAVPPAPVAPAIPGQVAAAVQADAARLFAAQVNGFSAATDARNKALEAQGETAAAQRANEQLADAVAAALALGGLVTVTAGPALAARRERKRERERANCQCADPAVEASPLTTRGR
ncbi:MAG TPA: hypothetical protein VNA20_01740 [Frankiaceae bacterium]|nr:hypothetical protein [Frankiaceae bacterium]